MVPGRPDAVLICEIQGVEGGAESGDIRGGVEDFDLSAGSEGREPCCRRVVVFVIPDDELLKRGWCQGGGFAARAEALPTQAYGAVDVDEDEEGSAGEHVDAAFVVDGGCDVVFLPVLCGEV